MIRYQGAAISAKASSARGSNVARSQVLKSRRTRQKASVTQKGISTATGPFANTPRAAAANAAYSHLRSPDLRCSHAASIEAAMSRLRSPSAVAARPMMKTPTEVAVQAAASHAAGVPQAASEEEAEKHRGDAEPRERGLRVRHPERREWASLHQARAPIVSFRSGGPSMSDLSQMQIPSMRSRVSPEEWQTRVDLAACYRLVHHYGMDDLVYNHISARVPREEGHFLINAYGMTYDEITASSLVKIDLEGKVVQDSGTGYGINHAGFVIHSAIHKGRPDVGCVIHTHSIAGMAVSALDCGLLPITQTAMYFDGVGMHEYESVAIDLEDRKSTRLN